MRTYREAEAMAKSLREALAAKNVTLSNDECLELVSKQLGFDEWSMLATKIALETRERETSSASNGVSLQPPVPVITVASAPEAKKFYMELLDFTVDWGWHESNQRPLYAQVSRSGVTLHLREHRSKNGATELFIRSTGLDALKEELSRQGDGSTILTRRTPDDRREIQIADPFGNLLRFSENNPPGTAND